MPIPHRDNYRFVGWYTDEACSGDSLSGDFYKASDVSLYAKWMTDSEYIEYCNGSSFERAINVDVGSTDITHKRGGLYFVFVPTESKLYTFSSSGASSSDSYACLYDTSKIILTSDDDGGSGNNFSFTINLIKSQKYYIYQFVWSGWYRNLFFDNRIKLDISYSGIIILSPQFSLHKNPLFT